MHDNKSVEIVEYLTECTLATIEKMVLNTRYPKNELRRQCSIACKGLSHLEDLGVGPECGGRVRELLNVASPSVSSIPDRVESWWKLMRMDHHPGKP